MLPQALFSLSGSETPADKDLSRVRVLSLPNGCNSLPPAVLPLLERFKKIYLWFDLDAAGQAAIKKFTAKLGVHRCVVVTSLDGDSSPPKDANDALRRTDLRDSKVLRKTFPERDFSGMSDRDLSILAMIETLKQAKATPYDRIQSFVDLRSEVLAMMTSKVCLSSSF